MGIHSVWVVGRRRGAAGTALRGLDISTGVRLCETLLLRFRDDLVCVRDFAATVSAGRGPRRRRRRARENLVLALRLVKLALCSGKRVSHLCETLLWE